MDPKHIYLSRLMDRGRITKAMIFGHHAHESISQKRKYSGLDYSTHTESVADIVAEFRQEEDLIIAALLHDVVEDVPGYTVARIEDVFGRVAARLVGELTDVYTHTAFPKLNRATRKTLENARLAGISDEGKLIKLADICDNTKDICLHDPKFARVYCGEMRNLLIHLRPAHYIYGNSELYGRAEMLLSA